MMTQGLERIGGRAWRYDDREIAADAAIHSLGLGLALVGTVLMLGFGPAAPSSLAARSLYCATLLSTLSISASYNLWPVSPLKWRLRRLDHAMIFALIAGTYTPFLSRIGTLETTLLLTGMWSLSLIGIALKLANIGRREWLSTLLYVALGWSGLISIRALVASLPFASLLLVLVGGLFYSVGTIFHHWRSLRFQNAIWHGFVLVGASCHYFAILLVTDV